MCSRGPAYRFQTIVDYIHSLGSGKIVSVAVAEDMEVQIHF